MPENPDPAMIDIAYCSKADNSTQHMLFYDSGNCKKKPLLVALHTWSNGYLSGKGTCNYLQWCVDNDWALVFPDFRGANTNPDAMGSAKAVADIADAVEHAKTLCDVDLSRIYLIGVSGGGHMALLTAALCPEIWAGVSAWVPIFDLEDWWLECSAKPKYKRYAEMIELCAGGAPLPGTKALEECRQRSSSSCLSTAMPFMLDINGGLLDGREGSVPFTHSLKAFNATAEPDDRMSDANIAEFYKTQIAPYTTDCTDTLYGDRPPVFRKASGNTRVTIFNGGHGIVYEAALTLLAEQQKGTPANWSASKASASAGFQTSGL